MDGHRDGGEDTWHRYERCFLGAQLGRGRRLFLSGSGLCEGRPVSPWASGSWVSVRCARRPASRWGPGGPYSSAEPQRVRPPPGPGTRRGGGLMSQKPQLSCMGAKPSRRSWSSGGTAGTSEAPAVVLLTMSGRPAMKIPNHGRSGERASARADLRGVRLAPGRSDGYQTSGGSPRRWLRGPQDRLRRPSGEGGKAPSGKVLRDGREPWNLVAAISALVTGRARLLPAVGALCERWSIAPVSPLW